MIMRRKKKEESCLFSHVLRRAAQSKSRPQISAGAMAMLHHPHPLPQPQKLYIHWSCFIPCLRSLGQHLDTSLSWKQGNVEIHQTKTKSVPKLGKIHMGTAWNIKTTSRSTQHRLHSGDYSSTKKTSSQLLSRRNAVNPATPVIYTPAEEHMNCTQSLC